MDQPRIPLEVIRVDSPCPADWDAMPGGDARRYCTGCRKFVHDLSAMTRDAAERLVCESAGDLCVRFTRAADGRVRTVDYRRPTDAPRRGWRFWTGIGLVGGLLALAAQAFRGPDRGGTATAGTVCLWPPATTQATQPSTQPATEPTGGEAGDVGDSAGGPP